MNGRARSGGGFTRRDALHRWSLHFGPNMTPMVDVVMVILIFFMASAAFMGEEWFLRAAIPIPAPAGRAAERPLLEPPPLRIDVSLDADEQGRTIASSVALQIEPGPLERVLERFASFPKNEVTAGLEVLIKPSARAPYRDVVRIHEACEAVGIVKVGIGVRAEGTGA
jgi:biopolymer transport protein ExbD